MAASLSLSCRERMNLFETINDVFLFFFPHLVEQGKNDSRIGNQICFRQADIPVGIAVGRLTVIPMMPRCEDTP